MTDITPMAVSILTLAFSIVSLFLIPVLQKKYSKEQLEEAMTWAKVAVNAAEQLAKSGVINLDERKDYAMKFLEEKRLTIDMDQLSNMVEAFVLELPSLITDYPDDEDIK